MKNQNTVSSSPLSGKLLVFEGADDVGKTTLAKALAAHLNERGIECLYASFPGREPGTLGHLIYQVHHYEQVGEIASVDPTALQLLHIAAHIDAIENRILPALTAGRCVILDRYWWSTWVYGRVAGSRRQSLLDMIRLEQSHWRGVKPDIVFHIHRKNPLDSSLTEKEAMIWGRWCSEYQRLARMERKNHQVVDVGNEEALEVTLRTVLDAIPLNSPV